MREPPYFAFFRQVDIRKLSYPRMVHVYVAPKGAAWRAPTEAGGALSTMFQGLLSGIFGAGDLTTGQGYAGSGSIFFFDNRGGCANCKETPFVDVYVDITAALRRLRLRPAGAALHVLVEDSAGEVRCSADITDVTEVTDVTAGEVRCSADVTLTSVSTAEKAGAGTHE